jgi:hypothetical protein
VLVKKWITPYIHYREELNVNAAKARAVLTQAKQVESYEGPVPEEDEKAISEAEEMIEMAENAWGMNIRGHEVESILRIAAEDFDGQELVSENGSVDSEETQAYEPADAQPETSEPEPEPDTVKEVQHLLTTVEPWEGYDQDKLSEIYEGLAVALEGDENPIELLDHVEAYEMAKKGRKRILERVEKFRKERSGDEREDSPPAQEPETQTVAPEPNETPEPEPVQAEQQELAVEQDLHRLAWRNDPNWTEPSQPEDASSVNDLYHGLLEEVNKDLSENRLHLPSPPTEQAPDFDYDWTALSDRDLQRLHSYFSNFAYYKNFILAREERIETRCRQAADEISRELLVNAPKYDEKGKEKKATLLDAEIESDPFVKTWRSHQRRHQAQAHQARQERDGYHKIVESMSRLESMRDNEHNRTRR